jgi:hypothetical protein
MIAYLSERENVVEQINSICRRLFDTWCEKRSVTSLAYLMHGWPLPDSTPNVIRRLGETMRELRRYHANQLNESDFHSLCELADLIDELIERSTPISRALSPVAIRLCEWRNASILVVEASIAIPGMYSSAFDAPRATTI